MKKIARILCAVDGDEPGRAAFDQALALARARDARLLIVCPVSADRAFNTDASDRVSYLLHLRARAEAAGIDVRVSVQQGPASDIVLLHARTRQPDLIVVSMAHGLRDGMARGAVAASVMRAAPVATLAAPHSVGLTPAGAFDHALCAVALGTDVQAVLGALAPLTRAADHRVTLLHVARSSPIEALSGRAGERRAARTALRRLQAMMARQEPTTNFARVALGRASREVPRAARTFKADLIAIGSRPAGSMSYWRGGITRALLRDAPVPVLAVPTAPGVQAEGETRKAA